MTFNKSVLAMAVAVAISTPAFAEPSTTGKIELEGTGSYSLDEDAGVAFDNAITIGATDTAAVVENEDTPAQAAIPGYGGKSLKLNGGFTNIDVSLKNNGTLTGNATNAGAALVLDAVTSNSAYIETNHATVAAHTAGNAIDIIGGSTISATTVVEGEKVAPHLIYNNGGTISAAAGHGINIKGSALTGNIINGSVAGLNDDNKYQDNTAGIITGGGEGNAAINITDSSLTGYIVNNAGSNLGSTGTGIKISAAEGKSASFTGNIINAGAVAEVAQDPAQPTTENPIITQGVSAQPAAVIGDIIVASTGTGKVGFTGAIENFGTIGNINIGEDVTGNIAINLKGGSTTGALTTNTVTTVNLNGGTVTGDVDNDGVFNFKSGTIANNTATDVDHRIYGIKNNGTFNQRGGDINAQGILNEGTFNLSGGTIIGAVTNTGRFNYTGGKIKSDVANDGGTFYVEGPQSIDGAYLQTAGSTLAMGLHTKTSLTANSFNLAKGSTVLIDLSRGDLYVQNGEKVELLKSILTTQGTNDVLNANYVISSNLVKVATTEFNDAGHLVLTFDRTSFTQSSDNLIKSGQISGLKANNVTSMATVLQKLDVLAKSNPAIAQLLNNIDGSPESFTSLLPDVSGASVAGAMSAASQSGSQVSVRATGVASGDILDNSGLWIQGLVSKGDQDNRNGEAYDVKSSGFVLGADTKLDTGLVVGAAYSFINTDSTTQNSNTESDYHMATAYAAQAIDQILLDGQAYYAWGDNNSRRNIGTTANYDSSLYGARVGAGYQFDVAPATRLIPTLSLEASRLSVDGYTEAGSAAALKMDSQSFNRTELGLNTELSKDYQMRNAMLTPSVNLGVFHDFEGKAQNSTVAFAAAPAESFNVTGTKPEKTRYVAGLGLDIMSNENFTVSAEYNYNWNNDGFDANSGAMKFRWDF